jgi:GT2 family glycosyltransferase
LISVAIVAFQSGPTLERCLGALKAQTFRDFEILIADNGSTDGAPQAAAVAHPDARLLELGANLGFAAANNRAAAQAGGRWLALINPDAYARPDWLEQMLAAAEAHPGVRCFTSRQLSAADPSRLDGLGDAMTGLGFPFRAGFGRPDQTTLGAPGEVFSPCGAAMMIDRELFLEHGGFDERFFCYCEDVDLGYRLRLAGRPVLLVPAAVVLHEGSTSTGGRRSDFSTFHGVRNRLWTYAKNTPPLLLWLTAPAHAVATAGLWLAAIAGGRGAAFGQGLGAGLAGLGAMGRERGAARAASSAAVARRMVWNPWAALRREGNERRRGA